LTNGRLDDVNMSLNETRFLVVFLDFEKLTLLEVPVLK